MLIIIISISIETLKIMAYFLFMTHPHADSPSTVLVGEQTVHRKCKALVNSYQVILVHSISVGSLAMEMISCTLVAN
jgi:hypothetical protein